MSGDLNNTIKSVRQFLGLPGMQIPNYQRPYKWTVKNVSHLFQDIQTHHDKTAYRLGSVVFHASSEGGRPRLDIVDGQQRTLTLVLTVWALIVERLPALERGDLKEQLSAMRSELEIFMEGTFFRSDISQNNLYQNYLEIRRLVSRPDFSESHIDFLLNNCEVVIFVLDNISEAFQFFDSQNARGRDLEPHDLLKAFHLREFPEQETELKADTVAHWEGLPSDRLAELFALYLYRIRHWSQGKSARFFGKNQVEEFKGVNLDKVGHFPYVESLRISHHYVDDYNSQYQRRIDGQKIEFPFCLDQMVINGRRFFEMAQHYQQQVTDIVEGEHKQCAEDEPVMVMGEPLDKMASKVLCTLNEYSARTRIGDRYVRSIFDCAVVFYMDKFGTRQLSSAVEKIFIWAYTCRIHQQVVQLATVDKYVLNNNIFRLIKEATQPVDVLSITLPTVKSSNNKNNRSPEKAKNDPLVKLFECMKYYE